RLPHQVRPAELEREGVVLLVGLDTRGRAGLEGGAAAAAKGLDLAQAFGVGEAGHQRALPFGLLRPALAIRPGSCSAKARIRCRASCCATAGSRMYLATRYRTGVVSLVAWMYFSRSSTSNLRRSVPLRASERWEGLRSIFPATDTTPRA